jgi:hypothetical protein
MLPFDTYFGRDTLMTLKLLMPVLQLPAVESGLLSVLTRLAADGEANPVRSRTFELNLAHSAWRKLPRWDTAGEAGMELLGKMAGAGCRIRTRDLRFTKPLLYQLS